MEDRQVDEELDLVIVGGGVSGISALKTYLALNPASSIALLDSRNSLGGVWARERLYAGLKTNNVLGGYEFSDLAMDPQKYNVGVDKHIPGEVVQEYLEAYCEGFGLTKYIRLGRKVDSIIRHDDDPNGNISDGSWVVQVIDETNDGKRTNIRAKKLIVATGLTTQPYLPNFNGQESFQRPLLHFVDFKAHQEQLFNATARRVTVLGNSKSGYDAAFLLADSGIAVDMIIRASGHGPTWMAPARVTPLKKLIEKLVNVRFLSWFSPCIWGEADGFSFIRRILHATWLGRKIVDGFWWILANDLKTLNRYDAHPETAKLKPRVGTLWISSGLGIFNYDGDVLEMVRQGKIKVHVTDIERLSEGRIHLANGDILPSDGMVCCTGWAARPNIKFLPESLETQLGLPTPALDSLPEETVRDAETHILAQLPKLKEQPNPNPEYRFLDPESEKARPLRLYRFIAPCSPRLASSRSIAFVGMTTTVSTIMVAQAQALWAAAYLSRTRLNVPSVPDMQWSTALHTQYCKLRYGVGANGRRVPDFAFDAVPYVDMLLHDLGLNGKRKGSKLKEWFEPYHAGDYKGIVKEYLEARG